MSMKSKITDIIRHNDTIMYWYHCHYYKHHKTKQYEEILHPKEEKNVFEIISRGSMAPKKVIYEITAGNGEDYGFFALYRWVLSALYVADRLHLVPYIRIVNSYYNVRKEDPRDNVFEYYYLQPDEELSYENMQSAANVVLHKAHHCAWIRDEYTHDKSLLTGYAVTDDLIQELARLRNKYLKYRPEVEDRLKRDSDSVLNGKKTIAIHYRGTDYQAGIKNHPVGLQPEDYFEFIDGCIEAGYEQIFVATDDQKGIESFLSQYPDKVVYYTDVNRSGDGMAVHTRTYSDEDTTHKISFEVLRDAYTLASCDGMICGNSQVTFAARIEKVSDGKEYSYLKIIDKGLYQ